MSVESWLARATVDVPTVGSRSRRTDLALASGILVALFAAIIPLLRVVDPSWWVLGSIVLSAFVLGAGFVTRWFGLPGIAIALVEAIVWLVGMTAMFGGSTSILWVVPTPASFEMVPGLLGTAFDQVRLGAAPLEAGFALSFLIVGAVGALALVMDHVVLTARMPLLAAVGLVAISLIPSIAVPADIDLASFILLAASLLFLLRTDTRDRQRLKDGVSGEVARPRGATDVPAAFAGVSATALGIGAIAVIVAIVATPLLPAPLIRAGNGLPGTGTFIDPTLELGDDLRQPREVEVLDVRSTTSSPPYLRAVTLTQFDGSVWQPDEDRVQPFQSGDTFPADEVDPDITVSEYRTTVEVLDLNSTWLPVPYPATSVSGLDGDWGLMAENRTVATRSASTQGQTYEVVTSLPRPTLEQIRAHTAAGGGEASLALPQGMPPVIAQTAQEVTAGTTNDYDALLAMQSWFRGPEFQYSLEAPVQDGFDGTGADAVADFLSQREGYCVHFASAFALMARTLGMPARIVVGYLPGSSTGNQTQGQTTYTVSSGQLHAWPEVHFEGIGWVPFEPTKSLGTATSFSPSTTNAGGSTTDDGEAQSAQPSAAPSTTPTTGTRPQDEADAGGTGGTATQNGVAPPVIGVGLLVLLALIAPAVFRVIRRRQSLAAADEGEPTAAWAAVQDVAIDLGIAVPAAESPRSFGARLVAEHGASPHDMDTLVRAIERASYAEDPTRRHADFGRGDEYGHAVRAVTEGLLRTATVPARLRAAVAPRSLLVRPGSVYADGRAARRPAASTR